MRKHKTQRECLHETSAVLKTEVAEMENNNHNFKLLYNKMELSNC
jgi:hypothetical protein